jgi:hypothetical protein
MYSASVSKIKSYYNYTKGRYALTYYKIVEEIKGTRPYTAQKGIGTLADAYLMDKLSGTKTWQKIAQELSIGLTTQAMAEMDDWYNNFSLNHQFWETQVSGFKVYNTAVGDLKVTMRPDIKLPNRIKDIKTSAMPISSDYMDDMQGFMYTDILECDFIDFEHFRVTKPKKDLTLEYQGMMTQARADPEFVQGIINSYIGFVKQNNLLEFLIKKEKK